MHGTIALRAATDHDLDFLYQVYAGTREEELAQVDWNDAQKVAFLYMQFTAQHGYYREQYPDAAYQVIMAGECAVGRLYVNRTHDEIRIVDIALLPEYRNSGIGSALLRGLLAEGDQSARPVRIHVERFNPALRLYERLGFRLAADRGVYLFLERLPRVGGETGAQPNTAS